MKKTIILIFIITLFGCVSMRPIPWSERQVQLQSINQWKITGVFGATYTNRSDIVYFEWERNKKNYVINLHGPMNVGAKHIVGNEKSICSQFDRSMPIASLKYWILALPAPQAQAKSLQFDDYGHLIQFDQQGWQIKYSKFVPVNNVDLPSKIELSNSQLKIKLVIKSWIINSV